MESLEEALWRIYRRPEIPQAWLRGGNLPWDEPDFSERMLLEHLDESHGAASRPSSERQLQINWLWAKLNLRTGSKILDVTCGPGLYAVELAARGCSVTGIDFSPAGIAFARKRAHDKGVADRCTFIEQDIRTLDSSIRLPDKDYDAAIFLYGQLAVFPMEEADKLLSEISKRLAPGGYLCVELLNEEKVDKENSSWWFTDDRGLWGDKPFLHLGERFWIEEQALSIERYHILELDSGQMTEITLCDQAYQATNMVDKLNQCGFVDVDIFLDWNGLNLNDAEEWIVYLAKNGSE